MKQPPKTPGNGKRPMSAKRQEILEKAFAQLRKSRAKIDPKIITKIREFIGNSPEIMKKLGLSEKPKTSQVKQPTQAPKPLTEKSTKVSQNNKAGSEKIDQAKNMEVMAKLMELNPKSRETIKSAIKKASD